MGEGCVSDLLGISSQVQLLLLTALFSRTFYILTLCQIRKPSILEMTAALTDASVASSCLKNFVLDRK